MTYQGLGVDPSVMEVATSVPELPTDKYVIGLKIGCALTPGTPHGLNTPLSSPSSSRPHTSPLASMRSDPNSLRLVSRIMTYPVLYIRWISDACLVSSDERDYLRKDHSVRVELGPVGELETFPSESNRLHAGLGLDVSRRKEVCAALVKPCAK